MSAFYSASTSSFYDSDVHSVMPDDAVPVSQEAHRALFDAQAAGQRIVADDAGRPVARSPAPLDADALTAAIIAATQARLDAFARTRGYDNILSACTYADSAIPQFAAEGSACVTLRDATWAALYAIQAEVAAGTRPVPASLEDVLPDLPSLVWADA